MKIKLDGEPLEVNVPNNIIMEDLILLIRDTYIDPVLMISAILLNGMELREEDWLVPIATLRGELEFSSDTPQNYIKERFANSVIAIATCYSVFRNARKSFESGDNVDGSRKLIDGVKALQAFVDWYKVILQLIDESIRSEFSIEPEIQSLLKAANQVVDYQLHQSFWAIGETLKNGMEPALDTLENRLRQLQRRYKEIIERPQSLGNQIEVRH